ncbi:MAG: pyridoxal-phosphate dependent enzyme [Thermoprotei archaeon]
MDFVVRCGSCLREREGLEVRCLSCGGPFRLVVEGEFSRDLRRNFPYISKWISLGEWNTPLINTGGYHMKLDFLNPTGSYKDRGSVTLISKLHQAGINSISEDSSGNAGASVAAYGARAGMRVSVFVPASAKGQKIRQIEAYGARVTRIEGSREDVARAAENSGGYFASHVWQPEFRDGIRSLAYEIVRDLGWKRPDTVFLPTSAGTLLLGVYEGFKHLLESGVIDTMPVLIAVQTEQVSPVHCALKGIKYTPPKNVTSIADALVSTNPTLLKEMVSVLRECGDSVTVSEGEIVEAHSELEKMGLLVEYSSATVLAAAKKYSEKGGVSVLVLTGNGLKTL